VNTHVISWNQSTVKDPEIRILLNTLGKHYPVVENGKGLQLSASIGGSGLKVSVKSGRAEIAAAFPSLLARGIGMLLSGVIGNGRTVQEKTSFKTVGLMLDCCRNAVMKVDYIKEWLRRSALMGYNQMMIYTKDTYELPGEECFGYLRGRYTAAEFKELDDYASRLGIEMVGCIQALGHLEPVLRWPRYGAIKDTPAELLTTEEKSYELINKMLDFYGSVFKSRRIHLGMDETHGLGRGRYMDLNGYRRPFDIYIDHLNRVAGECNRRGLKPMIWSDMFFRMGSKNMDYYDRKAVTPKEIIAQIPPEVQLTYWDYYHKDREFYREWIRRHRKLGSLPVMASAIWTWPVFWYNHRQTVDTVRPCIEACLREKVEEIVFTMWGDDGGYCDWSSPQAGACYAAEKIFGAGEPGAKLLERKFEAICDASYRAHTIAADITRFNEKDHVSAPALLWDDPLLGIYRKDQVINCGPGFWHRMEQHYAGIEKSLAKYPAGGAGNISLVRELASLLKLKIHTNLAVAGTYEARNKRKLTGARKLIVDLTKALTDFEKHYREQWYKRNKTFGYEVMQIRLAGQVARWRELDRRLKDLADGKIKSIPELEEKTSKRVGVHGTYQFLATASVYF
jgi:hypothetical protein